MKKILAVLLMMLGILPVFAESDGLSDIDEILSDNAFRNASNRYTSMLLYFFPEQTTRMGMVLGNSQLNVRTPQQETQATQALRAVTTDLDFVEKEALNKSRQIDLDLFLRSLQAQQDALASNRLANDPLYYASVFDSIFDLYLRPGDNTRQRNNDALARLNILPAVAEQAKQNLTNVSPFRAQLAMEKAYHALLSFDDVADGMIASALDEFATNDLKAKTGAAKKAINDMFELFKTLSQQDTAVDSRMGPEKFKQYLKQNYQIDTNSTTLSRLLNDYLEDTRYYLWQALLPFNQEEITVVGEDGEATTQPEQKKKAPVYTPPMAAQFYQIAQNYFPLPESEDVLSLLAAEVSTLAEYFYQGNVVYPLKEALVIKQLPNYYAYSVPTLSIPADGFSAFFVRLPSGNALAKEEALKKDFNTPQRKVMLSKQIFPGMYYQDKHANEWTKERNLYFSPTLRNGWGSFATDIAQEYGLFATPEELLAVTWDRYLDTIKAIVDYRLQNKEYDYADALNFLVNEQGFTVPQAEEIIRQVVAQPGEALSTIVGRDAIVRVYDKYICKVNDNFTHADLINLFMKVGNVPPADLAAEVNREYKAFKKKQRS